MNQLPVEVVILIYEFIRGVPRHNFERVLHQLKWRRLNCQFIHQVGTLYIKNIVLPSWIAEFPNYADDVMFVRWVDVDDDDDDDEFIVS